VTGHPDKVDAGLTEGLAMRPGSSWAGLVRAVEVLVVLYEGGGAGAWVRARAQQGAAQQ